MSKELGRSIGKTTLGGKHNEENTTEQWDQEWLSEMLSKVLKATFEEGHLSWDLNNKELICEDLKTKSSGQQKGSRQRPWRWEKFGLEWTMGETALGGGRMGAGGEEVGEIGRNQITEDWVGGKESAYYFVLLQLKATEGFWTREKCKLI